MAFCLLVAGCGDAPTPVPTATPPPTLTPTSLPTFTPTSTTLPTDTPAPPTDIPTLPPTDTVAPPTDTPIAATETPIPTDTLVIPPLKSGGLGLTRDQFDATYGPADYVRPGALRHDDPYNNEEFSVAYSDDDRAWWIDSERFGFNPPVDNPMSFKAAKAFALKFLPADAKLLKTEQHLGSALGYTNVVYIYKSTAISQLFPPDKFPAWVDIPDPWRGAAPGTFNVALEQSDSDSTVDLIGIIIGAYFE